MPPALPLDVFPRILAFLDQEERAAAGYNLDTCIRLKLPPAPLCLSPALKDRLTDLQRRRVSDIGVVTYNAEQSAVVWIHFERDDAWLFPHLQLIMRVVPNIVLRNATEVPLNFEWFSFYPIDPEGLSCPRYYIFHGSLPQIEAQPHSPPYLSSSGLHILRNRVLVK
jgi:hypothetical protein